MCYLAIGFQVECVLHAMFYLGNQCVFHTLFLTGRGLFVVANMPKFQIKPCYMLFLSL